MVKEPSKKLKTTRKRTMGCIRMIREYPQGAQKEEKVCAKLGCLFCSNLISLGTRAEDDEMDVDEPRDTTMDEDEEERPKRKKYKGKKKAHNSTVNLTTMTSEQAALAVVESNGALHPTMEGILLGSTQLYQDDRKRDGFCDPAAQQYPWFT